MWLDERYLAIIGKYASEEGKESESERYDILRGNLFKVNMGDYVVTSGDINVWNR